MGGAGVTGGGPRKRRANGKIFGTGKGPRKRKTTGPKARPRSFIPRSGWPNGGYNAGGRGESGQKRRGNRPVSPAKSRSIG